MSPARPDEQSYLCFSAQDWWYFNHAHSDFQLMTRIARDHRVLFVNSLTLRMPLPGRSTQFLRRIGRKAKSIAKALRHPEPDLPNLAVLSPVVVPFYEVGWVRALNARLVALQVRLALRATGMHRPACLVTIPTAWDALRHLDHGPVVYNHSDRHSEFDEADQDVVRELERALLTNADRVAYVSHALMEEEQALVGARAVFLDHGVDVDHFTRRPRHDAPDDIASLPRPIIGYFGGFDQYLVDIELLARVARDIPEATLLLIGDTDGSMAWVDEIPNAVWLGPRPYESIPAYGSCFDVALMPWLDNRWIRYANPIKMKEYLALGLAVVSTDFPEVHRYEDVIRIAAGHDAFVAAVRQTLWDGGPSDPACRRAVVADDTWDRRAEELRALCE